MLIENKGPGDTLLIYFAHVQGISLDTVHMNSTIPWKALSHGTHQRRVEGPKYIIENGT